MPDAPDINVNFRKFNPKSVTIKVELHLTKEFLIRKWIAVKLIHLAALILNCGIEVS